MILTFKYIMMKNKKIQLFGLVLLATTMWTNAQSVFTNEAKVANNGFDMVNYFTENAAKRGSKEFSTVLDGATYYFVNAEHLKMFKADPQKYLPMFDGYCAFAVAQMGQKVPVDPETFRIDDGKLYLFFNDYWEGKPFNTSVPWINNEAEMEALAAANWKKIRNKE